MYVDWHSIRLFCIKRFIASKIYSAFRENEISAPDKVFRKYLF